MSEPTVKVTTKPVVITVKSTGQRLVVSSPQVKIVTAGKLGPPGPAGESADGTFTWTAQAFDLVESQQDFVLEFAPRAGSISVYLNGLFERYWSIAGQIVTLE